MTIIESGLKCFMGFDRLAWNILQSSGLPILVHVG